MPCDPRNGQLIAGFGGAWNLSASRAETGSSMKQAGSGKVRISTGSGWLGIDSGKRYP